MAALAGEGCQKSVSFPILIFMQIATFKKVCILLSLTAGIEDTRSNLMRATEVHTVPPPPLVFTNCYNHIQIVIRWESFSRTSCRFLALTVAFCLLSVKVQRWQYTHNKTENTG